RSRPSADRGPRAGEPHRRQLEQRGARQEPPRRGGVPLPLGPPTWARRPRCEVAGAPSLALVGSVWYGAAMDLSRLNAAQRDAVVHGDAPLLVLAGAGTGKTTVITYRLGHLVRERGVRPERILA